MTAEEMRQYILSLIKGYAQNPAVQASEVTINTLSALAGDIEMIPLEKRRAHK